MLNMIPITLLVATMGAEPELQPPPPAETISQREPDTRPDEG